MSEAKAKKSSLKIQTEAAFKGIHKKRCSEIYSKFTGEYLCRSVVSM